MAPKRAVPEVANSDSEQEEHQPRPAKSRKKKQPSPPSEDEQAFVEEPTPKATSKSRKRAPGKASDVVSEPRVSERLKQGSQKKKTTSAEQELKKQLKDMQKRYKALEKQTKTVQEDGTDEERPESEEETVHTAKLFTSSINVKAPVAARVPPRIDFNQPPVRPPRARPTVALTPLRRDELLSVPNDTTVDMEGIESTREDDQNTPHSELGPNEERIPEPSENEDADELVDESTRTIPGAQSSHSSNTPTRSEVHATPSSSVRLTSASGETPPTTIQPQYKDGQPPSTRARLGDYVGITHSIARVAQYEYEALCLSKVAFPDPIARSSMVRSVWEGACRRFDTKVALDDHLFKLIAARGSRIRGVVVTSVRARVGTAYGFKESDGREEIAANVKIFGDLTDNYNYMYKDTKQRTGCCNVEILALILKDILFKTGSASIGVVYKKYFCPVPIPLMGLVFRTIRHCVDEWATGKRVEEEFTEAGIVDDEGGEFAVHIKRCQDWASLDEDMTTLLRASWYDQASKLAGLRPDKERSVAGLSAEDMQRARDELLQHAAGLE